MKQKHAAWVEVSTEMTAAFLIEVAVTFGESLNAEKNPYPCCANPIVI